MPTCPGCGREYAGYGATCRACRVRAAVVEPQQRCAGCGEPLAAGSGQGSLCADCFRDSPLERWKSAAREQCARGARAPSPPRSPASPSGSRARACAWSLEGWLRSLDFAAELAPNIARCVCPEEGEQDTAFLLTFLRMMPHEEGDLRTVEELLQRCGAVSALARALAQGGRGLAEEASAGSAAAGLGDRFAQEDLELACGAAAAGAIAIGAGDGLERFAGPAELRDAMKREHCSTPDADVDFVSGSHGITTSPRKEWDFVVNPDLPPAGGWPAESDAACVGVGGETRRRQPRPLGWLLERAAEVNAGLRERGEPELLEEEAIALRLYTGPMSHAYNAALRAAARTRQLGQAGQESGHVASGLGALEAGRARPEAASRSEGRYTTTVHLISSALTKLGKLRKDPSKVYRGLTATLPPGLLLRGDARAAAGAGFASATRDQEAALTRAVAGGPEQSSVLLELQLSGSDAWADLQWLSQYPHEAEVLLPPSITIRVVGTRVLNSVLVVEAHVDAVVVWPTIEELVAKRHVAVARLCRQLGEELEQRAAGTLAGSESGEWASAAEALFGKDDARLAMQRDSAKNLRRMMDARLAEITQAEWRAVDSDECFMDAVRRALEVRRAFETPCPKTIVAFLHPHLKELRAHKYSSLAYQSVHAWPQLLGLLSLDASRSHMTDDAVRALAERCPNIRHADFADCGELTDSAARFLVEGCRGLRSASFAGCVNLTDGVAEYLAEGCADLESVSFGGCGGLTDGAVESLVRGCGNLRSVNFSECSHLTDAAVRCLVEACKGLQTAGFSGCTELTDDAARLLADGCKSLQSANFSECGNLTDCAAQFLAEGCKGIREAYFNGCDNLTDKAVELLAGGCRDLRAAHLSECTGLTDNAARFLAQGCLSLEFVDLSGCSNVTDESAKHFAENCKSLRTISLTNCSSLTDSAVRFLAASCKALESLDVGGCSNLTDEAAKYLSEGCRSLHSISFSRCNNLTDSAAKFLSTGCRGLRSANFFRCANLTDTAVKHLAEGCGGLLNANFSRCINLTDAAAKHLSEGCQGLQAVDVGWVRSLTDRAAEHLARGCRGLQTATFSGCVRLTDAAVQLLAEGCTGLLAVDFSGCENLTDNAAKVLAEKCKALHTANFSECRNLTDSAATYLAEGCKSLYAVDFSVCRRVTDGAARHLEEAVPGCKVTR